MKLMKKKILAICSGGGHWIQMQRLRPAFEGHDVIWASVDEKIKLQYGESFYQITDANFDTKIKLLISLFDSMKIVFRERPDVIISTGAAPGFWGILWGRLTGARTLWIDSIANSERLSLSARLAKRIANQVLTQWEHLDDNHATHCGAVI